MPTSRPRKRASASSSRALKGVPLTTTSPLSGRSNPAITIRRVDCPEPDGPVRPIASPEATRRLISLRMWTRAAPEPSERLTLVMQIVSGLMPASAEVLMRLSMASALFPKFVNPCCDLVNRLRKAKGTDKLVVFDAVFRSVIPATKSQAVQEFRIDGTSSYGSSTCAVERPSGIFMHMYVLASALILALIGVEPALGEDAAAPGAPPIKIVVLGDSLSAGYGLTGADAFPAKLQKALKAKGIN